jgi:MFS family permease
MSSAAYAAPRAERLSLGMAVVLCLGAFDFGLEQSVIIPALPSLADHYGASLIATSWLATGFLVAGTVAAPLLGRLGDLYGKRRLLLIALAAFALGSLMCALTSSIGVAIAGRAVQGIGVAVAPLALGLARDTLSPATLPRAVGVFVGSASAGGALGFILSGPLVDRASPAAIFWFLFALSGLLLIAVQALVPQSLARNTVSLDLTGAALAALGLVAVTLAISKGNDWGWSSAAVWGLLAMGVSALIGFVAVERRAVEPLLDLTLVASRPFANANACAFVVGYGLFLAVFVVPQVAAQSSGLALETTEIGLLLLPAAASSFAGGVIGGRVVDRLGARAQIAIASLVAIASYLLLSSAHGSWAELAIPTAVIGLSVGLTLTAVFPTVLRGARDDVTSIAAAVPVVMRNTGLAVGLSAAFALIDAGDDADPGYSSAFLMGAVGAAALLLLAWSMPGRGQRARTLA